MGERRRVEVDESLVKGIALLARLDLSREEMEAFVSQFRDILDYVSILDEVDTQGVPPAYLSAANRNLPREDEVQGSTPTRAFLANAPESNDAYVVIPRVHTEQ